MSLPAILPSTRLAIQVAAAGILAAVLVDAIGVERPYWVMMSAVLVMVGSVGETFAKGLDRTIGTLAGLVAGVILDAAAARAGLPEIPLLVAAVAATVYLQFVSYRAMVAALTVGIVIMFRIAGADDAILLARLYDTAMGAAVAGLASLLVLPIPTQATLKTAIDAYVDRLAGLVDSALAVLAGGTWDGSTDARPEEMQGSEAGFETLLEALRLQSGLIGGRGRAARIAVSVLPSLRGQAESFCDAARAAAQGGIGREIAGEIGAVRQTMRDNMEALKAGLADGRPVEITPLDAHFRTIETTLSPRLGDPGDRARIVLFLNAILALRRVNRALRQLATVLK